MIKSAPREPLDDPVRELAMNAVKVLQHCSKCKFCVELTDFFEEDDKLYTVHKYVSLTLREYLAQTSPAGLTEKEALVLIK